MTGLSYTPMRRYAIAEAVRHAIRFENRVCGTQLDIGEAENSNSVHLVHFRDAGIPA